MHEEMPDEGCVGAWSIGDLNVEKLLTVAYLPQPIRAAFANQLKAKLLEVIEALAEEKEAKDHFFRNVKELSATKRNGKQEDNQAIFDGGTLPFNEVEDRHSRCT